MTMLGESADLFRVEMDAYVVVGAVDHTCSWQSCYRTTHMLVARLSSRYAPRGT
jgi:poly(3-hydroxyalkanoate) synthetase